MGCLVRSRTRCEWWQHVVGSAPISVSSLRSNSKSRRWTSSYSCSRAWCAPRPRPKAHRLPSPQLRSFAMG
eukprot:7387370-Prymnesium_polylepis.2